MRLALAMAAWLALTGSGCFLEDVDYTGKSCPCPGPDYRCNQATNLCEPAGGSPASSSGAGCTPKAVPQGFRIGWSTPNAVYWQWDPPEDLDVLRSYRVVVGETAADVESESNVTVFGPDVNPELDGPYLVRTTGVDPVRATFTDGLAPATTYFAKLVSTDTSGCEHASNLLSVSTGLAPIGDVPLFVDALPPGGFVLPAAIQVAPCAASGSVCLWYTSTAASDPYEIVRAAFDIIPVTMTAGDFTTAAYLEIRVGTDSTAGPTWSELRIRADGEIFLRDALVFRADGAMHTYQIPLRVLRGFESGEGLDHARLSQGVSELGAGTLWSVGANVYLDDVHIKW